MLPSLLSLPKAIVPTTTVLIGLCLATSLSLLPTLAVSANETRDVRRAGPRWPIEWSVENLHFHADYDPRPHSKVWEELPTLRQELADQLGIRINNETIHLILFAQANAYRGYMAKYFPDVPQRRALFIKRRGPGMVFAYANHGMDIDLRHETTHALLNASLTYVPLWLDEGLAEYFEIPPGQREQHHEHHKIVRLKTLLHQVPAITDLEAVEDLSQMRQGHYRDAWSWVHFLLHESDQSRGVLRRFLQDIQAGIPPGPLSRRMSAELPDARVRYLQHFR